MLYLVIINILAFLICYIDKRKAIKNKKRISERTLLFISLIGGCFGFLLGMYLFHHKTKKLKFKLVYLHVIIWIIIILKCSNILSNT